MALLSDSIVTELEWLYSTSHRDYHNMVRVYAILEMLVAHPNSLADPEAVEAAIWFCHAIHDTRAQDNEKKSAELARKHLEAAEPLIDAERIRRVCEMIEATATHTVPAFADPEHRSDAATFLDMDNVILGAEAVEFEAYDYLVRLEYCWAEDEEWSKIRAGALRPFLERGFVFHTPLFRDAYEKQARHNITMLLDGLGQ